MEYRLTIEEAKATEEGLKLRVRCGRFWTETVEVSRHEETTADVFIPASQLPPVEEWGEKLSEVVRNALARELVEKTEKGVRVRVFTPPEKPVDLPLIGRTLKVTEDGNVEEEV